MSSFLVTDTSINAIVTCLCAPNNVHLLPDFHVHSDDDRQLLATQLKDLNIKALMERYPTHEHNYSPISYRNTPMSNIAVFKLINCFICQCSEGHIPDTELYKSVDTAGSKLAEKIVLKLPEYDAASWN